MKTKVFRGRAAYERTGAPKPSRSPALVFLLPCGGGRRLRCRSCPALPGLGPLYSLAAAARGHGLAWPERGQKEGGPEATPDCPARPTHSPTQPCPARSPGPPHPTPPCRSTAPPPRPALPAAPLLPRPAPPAQVKLGLSHLQGSNLLRAYMHGFFIDNRLYQKAKVGVGGAGLK